MPIDRRAALGAIGAIIESLDRAYTGFSELFDAAYDGAERGRQTIQGFVHFDFDPDFKTRVISVPRGIEGMQDLWLTIREDLLQKFLDIKDHVESVLNQIHNLPPNPPGTPILQRTALVLSFIHALNSDLARLIREIMDLTGIVDDIRNRIETLDDLFLPSNSRKRVVDISYRKRNAP
jgi:hypothetical protein